MDLSYYSVAKFEKEGELLVEDNRLRFNADPSLTFFEEQSVTAQALKEAHLLGRTPTLLSLLIETDRFRQNPLDHSEYFHLKWSEIEALKRELQELDRDRIVEFVFSQAGYLRSKDFQGFIDALSLLLQQVPQNYGIVCQVC